MSRKALINDLVESGLISVTTAQTLQNDSTAVLAIAPAVGSAVADATGGATVDAEARTAINGLLAELRTIGVIAT